jgi:hypothetical protein
MNKWIYRAVATALTIWGPAEAGTVNLPEDPGIETSEGGHVVICMDRLKGKRSITPVSGHGTHLYSARVIDPRQETPVKARVTHLRRPPTARKKSIRESECKISDGGLASAQYSFAELGFALGGGFGGGFGGGGTYTSPKWFCLGPHAMRSPLMCNEATDSKRRESPSLSVQGSSFPFEPRPGGSPDVSSVSEPSTWIMFSLGLAGMGLKVRNAKRRSQGTGFYQNVRVQPKPVL